MNPDGIASLLIYIYHKTGDWIKRLGSLMLWLGWCRKDTTTLRKRTQFSYGLDGKVRDIRRLGDGKWNAGVMDGNGSYVQYRYNRLGKCAMAMMP